MTVCLCSHAASDHVFGLCGREGCGCKRFRSSEKGACPDCNGTGQWPDGRDCPACWATGFVDPTDPGSAPVAGRMGRITSEATPAVTDAASASEELEAPSGA